jgi:Uma2 family endonuclease
MATIAERLLTAEDFAKLPESGRPTELVRGRVVSMNVPAPRHGQIGFNIASILAEYRGNHDLGHFLINDAGVITEKDPDTVRGPDLAFYSCNRLPRGPLPRVYVDVAPELVFEIRSPTDRLSRLLAKVSEYLEAGVTAVFLVDDARETVMVYRANEVSPILSGDEELTFPDILPGFRVAVRKFFE